MPKTRRTTVMPRDRKTVAFFAFMAVALVAAVGMYWASTARTTSANDAYVSNYTPSPEGTVAPLPTVDLTRVKSVLFIGDSWTYGTAADHITKGFAYNAAKRLDVTSEVHGFGSVGYLNPGKDGQGNFAARWAKVTPEITPDLVIVEGSQNDVNQLESLTDAANGFITSLKGQFPQAQIVMMGPAPATEGLISTLGSIDNTLQGVATSQGVAYISPLALSWFNTTNLVQFMDPMNGAPHPNTAGHNFVAERLVAELKARAAN